ALPARSRIGDDPNKRITPAQSALPENLEPAPERGQLATSPPLIPLAPKERRTSAAIVDRVPRPQRPRQSLDRVPAPAGKTRRHDCRRLQPDCSPPGETHTDRVGKDHKLPYPLSAPRPGHAIRLARDSLSRRPRFALRPRSQLLKHP